jgi:hypothetical protein
VELRENLVLSYLDPPGVREVYNAIAVDDLKSALISMMRSICAGRSHHEITRWLVKLTSRGLFDTEMVNPNCASTDGYPSLPPAWLFHQFRLSLAPWSVRDALTDELFGRNTADRVAKGHRGIRGDHQGSWPCAAAAAPRMHAFERRGAATDKRPRSNPN